MNEPADRRAKQDSDTDREYFATHQDCREFVRKAVPQEWPEDNELLTSPPFTLVVRIRHDLTLKLGVWRENANTKNTYIQLRNGRVPVSAYLEHITE